MLKIWKTTLSNIPSIIHYSWRGTSYNWYYHCTPVYGKPWNQFYWYQLEECWNASMKQVRIWNQIILIYNQNVYSYRSSLLTESLLSRNILLRIIKFQNYPPHKHPPQNNWLSSSDLSSSELSFPEISSSE